MPQFLVIAHDGTDADAKARRQAARPIHFDRLGPMIESGAMVAGGAILDDAGEMIGSACIVEMADRAAVDAWLAVEPYVTGNVWQRIEVRPYRLAALRKS